MRKLAIAALALVAFAAPAFAADMPVKAPVYRAPMSWTGCYVGVNAGGGWGSDQLVATTVGVDLGNPHTSGFLGGGQIGCDYQTGTWVFGVEGMFDWANLRGTGPDPANATVNDHTKQDWLGAATGRVGYAFDRALIYAKGGIAWTHYSRFLDVPPVVINTESDSRIGWTVGGGLEYMIAPKWSVKVEYSYYDFGNPSEQFPGPGGFFAATTRDRTQTVIVGVNYRFGWLN